MKKKEIIIALLVLLMVCTTGFTVAAQPTSLSDTKRNVDKSDYLQSNSLYPKRPPLLVIDGVIIRKELPIASKDMPTDSIVFIILSSSPIITIDDISEVKMVHSENTSFCRGDIDAFLIKTKKENAVQDIILDGEFVHMKKAVSLGSFADGDTQYLRKCLKKEWKLKNDITSITFYREGKTICDKKNREHTVRIEITTE